jgi:hypothetical protein
MRRLLLASTLALAALATAVPAGADVGVTVISLDDLDGPWTVAYEGSTPSTIPLTYFDPDSSSAGVSVGFASGGIADGTGTTRVSTFPFPYTTDGTMSKPFGRATFVAGGDLMVVVRSPSEPDDFTVLLGAREAGGTTTTGTYSGRYATCGPPASRPNTSSSLTGGDQYLEGNFALTRPGSPAGPAASVEQYGVLGTTTGESPLCAQARMHPALLSRDVDPPPPARRVTGTGVRCDRGPDPGDPFTCTAQVADAHPGDAAASRPTGLVKFTSATGSFTGGDTCLLSSSGSTPNPTTSACTITYANPAVGAGTKVPVTANYKGSDLHAPSSGDHELIFVKPPDDEPPKTTTTPPKTTTTPPKKPVAVKTPTQSNCSNADRALPKPATRTTHDDPTKTNGFPNGTTEGFVDGTGRRASWCFFQFGNVVKNVGGGVGSAALGIVWTAGGAAAGTAMGLKSAGLPGGGIGFVIGGYGAFEYGGSYLFSASASFGSDFAKGLADPPDPKFRTMPKLGRTPKYTVRRGHGVSTTVARRAARWLTLLARSRILADGFGHTVDRAGGAQKAKSRVWEGRQMRRAIHLALALSRDLAELSIVAPRVAQDARRIKALRKRVSLSRLKAVRARIAKKGFTTRERRGLRALGLTDADIRAARAGARKRSIDLKTIPRSTSDLLGAKPHLKMFGTYAAFFRMFTILPDVKKRAALH